MQSKVKKEEVNVQEHHMDKSDIETLYSKLRRYCQFLSQNGWDGDDLAQESLLKAWFHYPDHSQLSPALLNKIAHNKWIDSVRKRSKEFVGDIPEQIQHETDQIIQRFEAIEHLVTKLTPKQAIIFTLKEGFQFQLSEIADVLGTTETSVKAAIFRAKQRIGKANSEEKHSLIDQYWDHNEREQLKEILYESLKNDDPTVIIHSIPLICSLQKGQPTCSMHKSSLYNLPSSTVYMAA